MDGLPTLFWVSATLGLAIVGLCIYGALLPDDGCD